MPELLEQLYFGKLFPADQRGFRFERHQELIDRDNRDCKEFMDKLSNTLVQEFLEILSNQTEEKPYESAESFIDGFRMGARMMLEILEPPVPLQPKGELF